MDEGVRFWSELAGRIGGPLSMRFILQPLMAALYATRDGLLDARAGRPPYFWTIVHGEDAGRQLLRQGFKAVGRMMAIGVVIDAIYQIIVLKGVRPLELVVVVLGLAFVPYLFLRGAVNRIARRWMRP
jgi:hypothetical protein